MNPCLDYAKNIVFAAPDESMTAGGVTYTSYEDVKDDLLVGKLAPEDLKEALAVKVNSLLEVCFEFSWLVCFVACFALFFFRCA